MANFMANFIHYRLTLNLDQRYKNKDSQYQICLILYFKGKSRYIPLGVYIEKLHWDKENERILPTAKMEPNTSWYNDRILQRKIEAKKILTSLDASDQLPSLTLNDLIKRIEKKESKTPFFDYLDDQIKFLRDHKKEGTAVAYEATKKFIKNYDPDRNNLHFDDITYNYLKTVEHKYMAKTGNSFNGLSSHLRTIRAVWNKAIRDGLASQERYPFKEYKIRHNKSHKTAIGKSDMEKLKEHRVEPNTVSWHGRNAYFFSFYCRGMNLSDIAKLRLSNIRNERIDYKRSKNAKKFSIKITDKISEILGFYTSGKQPTEYIFPIIDTSNHEDTIEKQITNFRNIINHSLKRWAKKLGIDPTLSFNTARHSWATIGNEMNVSINTISAGMGHSDIGVTQIYLDSFDNERIDDANDLITK